MPAATVTTSSGTARLPQVGCEGHHLALILLLQPLEDDRGVQAACAARELDECGVCVLPCSSPPAVVAPAPRPPPPPRDHPPRPPSRAAIAMPGRSLPPLPPRWRSPEYARTTLFTFCLALHASALGRAARAAPWRAASWLPLRATFWVPWTRHSPRMRGWGPGEAQGGASAALPPCARPHARPAAPQRLCTARAGLCAAIGGVRVRPGAHRWTSASRRVPISNAGGCES